MVGDLTGSNVSIDEGFIKVSVVMNLTLHESPLVNDLMRSWSNGLDTLSAECQQVFPSSDEEGKKIHKACNSACMPVPPKFWTMWAHGWNNPIFLWISIFSNMDDIVLWSAMHRYSRYHGANGVQRRRSIWLSSLEMITLRIGRGLELGFHSYREHKSSVGMMAA